MLTNIQTFIKIALINRNIYQIMAMARAIANRQIRLAIKLLNINGVMFKIGEFENHYETATTFRHKIIVDYK